MTAPLVAYRSAGGVATITLSRPGKLNAFNSAMLRDLRGALDRAAADKDLRVAVLTGEGRAFSTGQDLAALAENGGGLKDLLEEDYTPLVLQLMDHPLVTVAAVNGPALGAAASIALACDIAVAAESASLCQAFVRIGLVPDAGGTWLLPRIAGVRRALALALTGDQIPAREAQAMGLVYRVFPDAGFAEDVEQFARRLATHSPLACRLIKQGLRESLGNDLPAQLALEADLQGRAAQSAEFRDAVRAFLERKAG